LCFCSLHRRRRLPPQVETAVKKIRYLVLIDTRTGAVDCISPGPAGPVTASVADGSGGWFIGGTFRHFGGLHRPVLAHLDRNGGLEPSFRPALPVPGGLTINKLVLHGSVLYAGWTSAVAALDARTGKQIWKTSVGKTASSNSGCCGGLNDIAYANGALYVVGVYKLIGGVARHDVAALDARTGRPLNWTVEVGPPGKSWIVDRDTGRATPWAPAVRAGSSIDALVVAGGEVLVGGNVRFAAFDSRTARPYAWTAGVLGSVSEFAVLGRTVYLGGDPSNSFKGAGHRTENNLAAVRLPGGHFTSWTPSINTEVDVQTLAASGNTVLAGGGFCATPGGC
jgi:outer membrane protein assembly factor BamB